MLDRRLRMISDDIKPCYSVEDLRNNQWTAETKLLGLYSPCSMELAQGNKRRKESLQQCHIEGLKNISDLSMP